MVQATQRGKRRLAAIFAADVVGYAGLVAADEAGTLGRLRALFREIVQPLAAAHGGRIFRLLGDAVLAEFTSAVEALRCAISLQEAVADRAQAEAGQPPILLRIAIALGDVVVEGGDLFGDGVNIAARMEALAEPGGILVSAAVAEQARGRVECALEDAGTLALKNIPYRVAAFRVRGTVSTEASAPRPGRPPLPGQPPASRRAGKPSIVVMPFNNHSTEPGTEYFSYGLTEDIIRLLACNRWLEVLSRHSAAAFRGRDVTAQEIGAALGVRYLVQGSVAKRSDRVRIVSDLVCAESGSQLWSEVYNCNLADLLQVQDTMAQQIAATIEPELSRIEREAAVRRPPSSMDAWDCYQRGLWSLWGFTTPSLDEAERMFRRAMELDPGFARAHGALSYVHLLRTFVGEAEERPALLEAAMRHARDAVALDDRDCMNLCVLGRAHCMLQEYEDSVAFLEQSVALNPSFAQGWFALAFTLTWCGRQREALALVERATELSPRDPHLTSFHHLRALACFSLGDLEAAVTYSRMANRLHNASHSSFAVHAAALGLLGRGAEAQGSVAELLRRKPRYTCTDARNDLFFCADEMLVTRLMEGLRRVGVPEGSAVSGPGKSRRPDGGPGSSAPKRGAARGARRYHGNTMH